MPPRPSSRCCGALQSRTKAPNEAIWVTDDVLRRAFQRYLGVSRAGRRALSSAPGPIYHRKRFGRRQMTELNSFQSIGSLPVWALPDAPDMSKWQWQPPKPDLWSSAPAPAPPPAPVLVGPTLEPLEPPTPPEAAVSRVKPPVDFDADNKSLYLAGFVWRLRKLHVDNFGTAEEYRTRFETLAQRIVTVMSKGKLSGPATAELYFALHGHIEIACRVFPELDTLFVDLMSAMARGIESAREVDRSFCIATPLFWEEFSRQLARHEINAQTAKLFVFVMHNMPPRHGPRALQFALSGLNGFFNCWKGAELHGEPEHWDWAEISHTSRLAAMWSGRADKLFKTIESDLATGRMRKACQNVDVVRRLVSKVQRFTLKTAHLMSDDWQLAETVAEALKQKDPRCYKGLYRQATALLGTPSINWTRAHYNWLQVMARLPQIKTPQFKKMLHLFAPRGHAALSHIELCNLLLLHWSSQGMLKDWAWTRRLWNDIRGRRDYTALAALALAVNKSTSPKECTAIFWDFWSILRTRTGGKTLLRHVRSLSWHQKLSSRFLQRMAWTSNDHRTALLIHHVLVKQTRKAHNFWWPPFWDKFAAKLSKRWKYPLIDPILLARKMLTPGSDRQEVEQYVQRMFNRNLEPNYRQELQHVEQQPLDKQLASYNPTNSDKGTREWILQVKRLKSSLQLLRHARQLTNRQALQYVTIFTSVLANKQGYLSALDLATLTSVIMRTLDQGRCGALQRFRWYLGIIYRHLGEEACLQVGIILKRRRQANWRAWQMRLSRLGPRMKQEGGLALERSGHDAKPTRHRWKLHIYANRRQTTKKAARNRRLARSTRAAGMQVQASEMTRQPDGESVDPARRISSEGSPNLQKNCESSTVDDEDAFDAMLEQSWKGN